MKRRQTILGGRRPGGFMFAPDPDRWAAARAGFLTAHGLTEDDIVIGVCPLCKCDMGLPGQVPIMYGITSVRVCPDCYADEMRAQGAPWLPEG